MCNNFKGTQTHALDPETRIETPLFNPRHQVWTDHFYWSDDGAEVVGRTACGRATVIALKLNNLHYLAARSKWVDVGWHPPGE